MKPDGQLKWRYKTGNKVYLASPGIGPDGTIYCGSYDSCLYALNPDGTLKWKTNYHHLCSAPAIAPDSTIYIMSLDGYFYAFNPDGTLKWAYGVGTWIYSSPAVGSDGTIYIGALDTPFLFLPSILMEH